MTVQFTNGMARFELQHLYKDTFTWLNDWSGTVVGGKPTNYPKEHYMLHFHPCKFDRRKIGSVTWLHDPESPEGGETIIRIE